MAVFNFMWYCIKSMINLFSASTGYTPNSFSLKDGLIGGLTLIVIMPIIFLILWITRVIKLKKRNL